MARLWVILGIFRGLRLALSVSGALLLPVVLLIGRVWQLGIKLKQGGNCMKELLSIELAPKLAPEISAALLGFGRLSRSDN